MMRNDKAPVIACLIALAILMLVAKAYGATVQYPISFGGDYDSVRIFWWEKDGVDWNLSDSMKISTFPLTDSIALDDAKDYKIVYWYWEGADQLPAGEFIKFTAGAATVSSTDKEEIAWLVEETLKVHHGDGSWLTGTGTGDKIVTIYAIDTSGIDDSVMRAFITVNTVAGSYNGSHFTNSNGYWTFTLPSDTMVYLGSKAGYTWLTDTIVVSGDSTVTLYGYNVPLQESPDPNLCRVQGYIFVSGGKPTKKIKVTFTNKGGVYNFCDSTAFIPEPVSTLTSVHDDSLGFFYADLIPSGCLLTVDGDSLQYTISAELEGSTIKKKLIWIPQAASYEIVW